MGRISERVHDCIVNGRIDEDLEQLIDFQLYLISKKIMQHERREDRTAILNKYNPIFHERIRNHAIRTNRYFSNTKNNTTIDSHTDKKE